MEGEKALNIDQVYSKRDLRHKTCLYFITFRQKCGKLCWLVNKTIHQSSTHLTHTLNLVLTVH